ncbi:MAG: hypothetical protein KJ852_11345 [Gammaproteobacteria bacterium]|nr:hypothetical protein [Gammaproteobacteria bacterium]MBU0787263.1 hypothetical protein [Gammaproteobacteria bacterium]MBU0816003.1 hypothetical protein [Gammaproteobacteria bacterium]MBU1787542.1 hypothetical protein [Gammaproteobacteria bacterium]
MASFTERILILCKTYPSPSAKYAETSCVAGMTADGRLIRLYPVPFRLVADDQQFRKWQWITARLEKARDDHRPESHRIFVDTIECDVEPLPAGKVGWPLRAELLAKIPVFSDFAAIEKARVEGGVTLARLRPTRIVGLDIKKTDNPDWTDEEKEKLLRMQQQSELFDEVEEGKQIRLLEKLPFDFHYRYECDVDGQTFAYKHKLVDWEVGALYRTVRRQYGDAWEAPFRAKLEQELPSKDLQFLLGTIHRFPGQWLLVSLIYPPKPPVEGPDQAGLF